MKTFKAIIIEENINEAEQIKKLIEQQCADIIITDMTACPISTKNSIEKNHFDIIIMGLQTGRNYAFDLLENSAINIDEKEIILLASEKERRSHLFANAALDCIARPLATDGLPVAIQKARNSFEDQDDSPSSVISVGEPKTPLHLIAIPSIDEVRLVKVADIIYLKSDGKYTSFFTTDKQKLMSSTNLGFYEKKLENNRFFRVHNSYLIHLDEIVNLHKRDGMYVEMSNGDMIPVAKRKKDSLFQCLGIK